MGDSGLGKALNAWTFGASDALGFTGDGPDKPKLRKPPAQPDLEKAKQQAAQKAKEAAIGAYSSSDTVLTAGKGLGNVPAPNKSLWKTLGAG